MVHSCEYNGKSEKCLLKDGYPITKNGKISAKRIVSAAAYGSKNGVIGKLKNAGLCKIAKSKGIHVHACKK